MPVTWAQTVERVTRIELALSAWEFDGLGPLTVLTWTSNVPLVTVIDPSIPGLMARQWPVARWLRTRLASPVTTLGGRLGLTLTRPLRGSAYGDSAAGSIRCRDRGWSRPASSTCESRCVTVITLSADLTLPTSLPAPAVVIRTPYGKTGERQSRRNTALAKAGYVSVHVDVRGRGDSDGTFQPYRNDGPDGADVIAWVAAQDWCTGDVATYGGSYGARIQWLTALEQPPALRAMVCVVTPSDPFVEWPTGLPTPMHINWYRLTDARMPQYLDDVDWMAVYRHRPLLTMDEAAGFVSPGWREELRHRTLDDWWEPVRYQHRIGEIDVPVLHISGWYDDEQIGTPANFAAMVAAGRSGQRLLMGPWGHAVNTTRTLGEVDFGPDALIDLDALYRRLPRRAGQGHQAEIAACTGPDLRHGRQRMARRADLAAGRCRGPPFTTSPATGSANSRFGDGQLVASAVTSDQPPDKWTHDPDRPVPVHHRPEQCADRRPGRLPRHRKPWRRAGFHQRAAGRAAGDHRAGHCDRARRYLGRGHRHHGQAPGRAPRRLHPAAVRRDGAAALPGRLRRRTGSHPRRDVRGDDPPVGHLCAAARRSPAPGRDRVLGLSRSSTSTSAPAATGSPRPTGVTATNRFWHTPSRPSRLILG